MRVKMHELSKENACKARRNFEYAVETDVSDFMKKAGIIKKAIADILINKESEEDVKISVMAAFEEIPYTSNRQRELHAADALRQIFRYTTGEKSLKRSLIPGMPADVDMGNGLTVSVNPDYIVVNGDNIEVIKLKTSKPSISQSSADKGDLGLYSLLLYGRQLVPPGNKANITASYYFLRKNNDSSSQDSANFDEDFFELKGGRNIVEMNETYENVEDFKSGWDSIMEEKIKAYVEGSPKEECSKEDCENCQLKKICQYTESPTAVVKTAVIRSLKDLNLTPAQEKVVEYEKGVVRVNAGAGAGKTMVVSLRVATLINKGVDPKEILCITFTNAGAEEMRQRIGLILDDFGIKADISEMYCMTFNAFGDMIIGNEYERLGFTEKPTLIDDVEKSRIIADLLNANRIDGLDYRNFDTNMKTCMGALAAAKAVFAIVKAGQYSVSDAHEVLCKLGGRGRFFTLNTIEQLIGLYDQYDQKLREENLIEFSDQEVLLFELLHQDPYYLEKFGFKHVIVDEAQDSSEGQIKLVKKLRECPMNESVMFVGDDSQSIFGFRDTSPYYMLHFEEFMEEPVDDIFLVENHRSTPEILDCANKMNEKREDKVHKDLIATRPSGLPVVAQGYITDKEETEFIINDIKRHLEAGTKPEDIAIIAATRYEIMKMGDLLGKEGIPSVMLNPEPLLENSRVLAAIAFCKGVQNPNDTEDILVYANCRAGGDLIGKSREEIDACMTAARAEIDALLAIGDPEERKKKLVEILEALDTNEDEVYESMLQKLAVKRWEKLLDYVNDFLKFGSGAAYRRVHNYPGVVLTTAHSSKGLEWPVVYNMLSKYETEELHTGSQVARELTEERKRLLFVSMTRARDELIMTGQYTAFGTQKTGYTYNGFLNDAIECSGGKRFTAAEVAAEKKARKEAEAARKKAEKEAADAALKAGLGVGVKAEDIDKAAAAKPEPVKLETPKANKAETKAS